MTSILLPSNVGLLSLPPPIRSHKQLSNPLHISLSTTNLGSKKLWSKGTRERRSRLQAKVDDVPVVAEPSTTRKNLWVMLWASASVVFPLWNWRSKLQSFLEMEEQVESTVKSVAMAVDQAAEAAEEMAEDLASKLPEGSKLKEAACFVECVAHEAEKDAELTLAFVEKVDDFKEEVRTQVDAVFEKGKPQREL